MSQQMNKPYKTTAVGAPARDHLVNSLSLIASAVGSTLGPYGRPWGYDQRNVYGKISPTWSKDGLTVLRSLWFEDPATQAVLHYCKQASSNSVLASGDGTTSTIVLAAAVANAIHNSVSSQSPQALARTFALEADVACEWIRRKGIKTDDAARLVALTSTNGDQELTDVVMEAIGYTSAFGTLLVEKNPASSTKYQIKRQDGYGNCGGYNHNLVVAGTADPKASAYAPIEWKNPVIALFNGNLVIKEQLDPILKAWNGEKGPLVIVAYDVAEELMNRILMLNRTVVPKGGHPVFVVKPKLTQEIYCQLHILRDIGAYCGIKEDHMIDGGSYRDVTSEFFGTCGKVTITPSTTMFLGRADNHWVEKRVGQNNSIIQGAKTDFDRQATSIRNAELAEGLVYVEMGGALLPELSERAHRFDDASKAAQACLQTGAVAGGGISYINAGHYCGLSSLLQIAMSSILQTIMDNYDPTKKIILNEAQAYKIDKDGIKFGDPLSLGVVDSVETVCAVIKNGVALGCNIATLGGFCYRDLSSDEESV